MMTCEIYTLSLHDALPISAPQTVANLSSVVATPRPYGVAAGDYDKDGDVDFIVGRITGNVHLVRSNGNGTDRKSTRLNSSHGYISYAVFRLKIKNTLHTDT